MSVYFENGKTIKHYCTTNKTDKAIITLLDQMEDLVSSETDEGYEIKYVLKDRELILKPSHCGIWKHDGSHWANRWLCSGCGYLWVFDKEEAKYCPNCGTPMGVKKWITKKQ